MDDFTESRLRTFAEIESKIDCTDDCLTETARAGLIARSIQGKMILAILNNTTGLDAIE